MMSILLAAPPLRILFVGNSLLNFNDVPETVCRMLESDGRGRTVVRKAFFVGHLEDVPRGSEIDREVTQGAYDIVVLQAAMVSSSHTRTYAQTRGIEMAKAAKARKARVLLYVEWSRRGIDETEYTINVYRGIAKATGAEIVPVALAWDDLLKKQANAPLYASDGNHAQPAGSFLAALTTYFSINGQERTPSYRPAAIDAAVAQLAMKSARMVTNG